MEYGSDTTPDDSTNEIGEAPMRFVSVAPTARRHQAGVSDQRMTHTTASAFMAPVRPKEIS